MKILHIITFVDANRSYGGPLSVALGLAEEQARQNHEVTLVGLTNKEDRKSVIAGSGPTERLFSVNRFMPGQKFSKLFSLKAAFWVWKNQKNFDVIHMHFSRDIFQTIIGLGLRPKQINLTLQPHGMLTNVVAKEKFVQFVYDWLLTNRVLKKANLVLALQDIEKAALLKNFKPKRVELLPNGVAFNRTTQSQLRDRKLVVFVSRLHVQKNPMLFVEAALTLIGAGSDLHFAIAGPDGGESSAVIEAIDQASTKQLRYLGALQNNEVRDLFSQAGVLVLPSIDDPFPMVVLEALSMGLQVAISESCGIAAIIHGNNLGEVFNTSLHDIVKSIGNATSSPRDSEVIVNKARQLFDISLIVGKLDFVYRSSPSNQGRQII